jgi:phosphoenolpyruvate carboxykinase (ATP)
MPRHPSQYGDLLRRLIDAHKVDCWLVNTGWTGGAYGTGKRMPMGVTRTLLGAALDGSLKQARFRTDPHFGFAVPLEVAGVQSAILDPRSTWAEAAAYDRQAALLVGMFIENFGRFESHVGKAVLGAAPRGLQAAE